MRTEPLPPRASMSPTPPPQQPSPSSFSPPPPLLFSPPPLLFFSPSPGNRPRTTSEGCSLRPLPMFLFRSPERRSRAGVCRDPAAATTIGALTTRRKGGWFFFFADDEELPPFFSKGSGEPAGSGAASTPAAANFLRPRLLSWVFPLFFSSSTRSAIVPVRISAPARAASVRKVCVWSCLSPVGQPPKQQRPQSAAEAEAEAQAEAEAEEGAVAAEQLRGTRPACCPRAASPSASLELGPLCGGREQAEAGEEEFVPLQPPPPPPPPPPRPTLTLTRIRAQTAARALSNLLPSPPSSSPPPFSPPPSGGAHAGATGRPPTSLHSFRTWSGVGNDAHQLIRVPPPSVDPASAVAERLRDEQSVPRS